MLSTAVSNVQNQFSPTTSAESRLSMSGKHALIVFFILLLVFASGVTALFYTALPFWINPQTVQKELIRSIETVTENPVTFSQTKMVYFPRPAVWFQDFIADWSGQREMHLEAKSLKIRLRILPLLFRQIKMGGFEVQAGRLTGTLGTVENVRFRLRPVPWQGSVIRFDMEGNLSPISKAFAAKGLFSYDASKEITWNAAGLEGNLSLRDFNVRELGVWLKPLPIRIENGQAVCEIKFSKQKENAFLQLSGQAGLDSFVYQVQSEDKISLSPSIKLGFIFDFKWNPFTEEFVIESSRLDSPIGALEAKGEGSFSTGQIQEIRVWGTQVALEEIPQYWIPLKKVIPSNFGFSGISNFEISLSDSWNHLSLHASWDLTPAILTYTHYFSKPKDFPLQAAFDLLLKGKQTLSGDFSLRFPEMTLKGTVKEFDVPARKGQINMITNKFPLKGWESTLIPLQNYVLDGQAKILGNWEGDFNDPKNLKTILNLTLDDARFQAANGSVISDVNLSLDYGTMGAGLKQARFTIGESVFQAEASVYHPFENPAAEAKISASQLKPSKVISILQEWAAGWLDPASAQTLEGIKGALQNPVLTREPIERFETELQYEKGKWMISRLVSEIYGGKLVLQGEADHGTESSGYKFDAQVDRVSLARVFAEGDQKESPLEGNLFLKGHFEGVKGKEQNWLDVSAGEGSLILTNGQFRAFDLMGAVSKLPELKALGPHVTGGTPFDDIHSAFSLKEKKVTMSPLTFVSPKLSAEGSGGVGLDGVLNYRLNVFLSGPLTKEIMEPLFGQGISNDGKQLGPISFLLSGRFATPEIQPDPELLPKFSEQFSKKKTQKVLTNFLPEDVLFERRASNS